MMHIRIIQIISVLSTIFVAVSIVGMTISTLEILQYQVTPFTFGQKCQINNVPLLFLYFRTRPETRSTTRPWP